MNHATSRGTAPRLATPTDLGANAAKDIAGAINGILADTFALYLKTKNFHWHISGPHFRDYHLLLDEQAEQIFATTDVLAERVRKIGQPTLRSIGDISRQQRLSDNDAPYVEPQDMLAELRDDNQRVVASMREAHDVCDEHNDVATASLLETFIDDAEKRVWFLYEASRKGDPTGSLATVRPSGSARSPPHGIPPRGTRGAGAQARHGPTATSASLRRHVPPTRPRRDRAPGGQARPRADLSRSAS